MDTTRPNDADFARARLALRAPCPIDGIFMFGRDFRARAPEFRTEDIALLRGRSFTDDEVRAALDGDGQDLHDMGAASYDGLWVRFPRPDRLGTSPDLREVWYQSSSWQGEAFASLLAQTRAWCSSPPRCAQVSGRSAEQSGIQPTERGVSCPRSGSWVALTPR